VPFENILGWPGTRDNRGSIFHSSLPKFGHDVVNQKLEIVLTRRPIAAPTTAFPHGTGDIPPLPQRGAQLTAYYSMTMVTR